MSTRALLASPLGFLIGVSVGALGGGGSILAVPLLVYGAGQQPTMATTTSLMIVGVASLAAAHSHWRSGRVRLVPGLVFGLVGIAGSLAGSALNRRLDDDILLLGFALLMLVAAWRMVIGCPSCTKGGEAQRLGEAGNDGKVRTATHTSPSRLATIAVAGTTVGFLTGLFGVGGGFVVVPALALVLRLPMPAAIGTSLLVVAINCGVALAARAGTATIDWGTTLLFGVTTLAGVGVGTRVADRLDANTLQRSFAGLLVAVALYTGIDALTSII